MSGKTEVTSYAISLTCLVSAFTDLQWKKIFNIITFPAAVLGVMCSFYFLGWRGGLDSLFGLIIALALYGWMYALKWIGAGDVKLMMALGTWGGSLYITKVAILAIIVGGLIGVVLMIVDRKLTVFCNKIYLFFLSLVVSELVVALPKIDKNFTFPFGIPISIAAIWIIFADPFIKWGSFLWP
jgi:prepilin peptidase CpaA